MLNWSFIRLYLMKIMIGWRVRYCYRVVFFLGVLLDEFWVFVIRLGISILLFLFKYLYISISESIFKFKVF